MLKNTIVSKNKFIIELYFLKTWLETIGDVPVLYSINPGGTRGDEEDSPYTFPEEGTNTHLSPPPIFVVF